MTAPAVAERPASSGAPGSLPAVLARRGRETPDRVALRRKKLGRWREYGWAEYSERATAVGMGLKALGVEPGDKVAIHSENRPAWVLADMGIQGIGAVSVGVYPTSPAVEVEYLVGHSESVVLIAEDEEQLDKAMSVRDRLPLLRMIVVVDPRGVTMLDDPRVMTFADVEELGRQQDLAEYERLVAGLDRSDVAIIVYTSGTTGPPKGAMISHANLMAAVENSGGAFDVSPDDEVLSYLPLCHVAERLISVVNAVGMGYVVNFGESGETFAQDLLEVQPTFFLGVPRVWEKMMAGIEIRMGDASRTKQALFRFWRGQGARLAGRRMQGRETLVDRLWYRIGWLLMYRSLLEKIGMSRAVSVLSGAAPIAPQVLEFFWALGVPVREGYGMTENTAQATYTPVDDVRIGTVGVAAPGVEVMIADDGEILTRGACTFVGYFKNPEATAETVDSDEWLHTGDVGEMDADGFVTITDRKKDIIITAGGKNVSPSEIENRLKVSPFVREAVVIGDQRKYLTALIGIEQDTVGNWATREEIPFTTYEDLSSKPEVVALVEDVVAEVNAEFAQVETIKKFRLLAKELDTEDGELTATQKVKRAAITDQFGDVIEEMYP